jgi:FkbM family methyltransferase
MSQDAQGYYSSNGVDRYLEENGLLPEFGYACDVGANDGEFFSNSLHFEEKGWLVLCVEPNPLLEPHGRAKRKLWRPVAASDHDGERDFVVCGSHPYASTSGFHVPATAAEPKYKVQCLRLDRLLEEAGFPRLDFLTMDVELHEPQVLAGFTAERWKPTIIVVEDQSETNTTAIPGYERIHRSEHDTVFRRVDGA